MAKRNSVTRFVNDLHLGENEIVIIKYMDAHPQAEWKTLDIATATGIDSKVTSVYLGRLGVKGFVNVHRHGIQVMNTYTRTSKELKSVSANR